MSTSSHFASIALTSWDNIHWSQDTGLHVSNTGFEPKGLDCSQQQQVIHGAQMSICRPTKKLEKAPLTTACVCFLYSEHAIGCALNNFVQYGQRNVDVLGHWHRMK